MLEIFNPRTCPNCKRQITVLRAERKVHKYFEMTFGMPDWNDYEPSEFDEGEWVAICYEVNEVNDGNNDGNEGCMEHLPLYAPDQAEDFMRGNVDGYGNELTNVKARSV